MTVIPEPQLFELWEISYAFLLSEFFQSEFFQNQIFQEILSGIPSVSNN